MPKPDGTESAGLNVVRTDSVVPLEGVNPKLAAVWVLALPSELVKAISVWDRNVAAEKSRSAPV